VGRLHSRPLTTPPAAPASDIVCCQLRVSRIAYISLKAKFGTIGPLSHAKFGLDWDGAPRLENMVKTAVRWPFFSPCKDDSLYG